MPNCLATPRSIEPPRMSLGTGSDIRPPVEPQGWLSRWIHERRREGSSWLVSLAMHLSLLALLGTIFFRYDARDGFFGTVLTRGEIGIPDGVIDGSAIAPDFLPPPAGDRQGDAIDGAEAAPDTVNRGFPLIALAGSSVSPREQSIDPEPDDEMETGQPHGSAGIEKAARGKVYKTVAGKEQGANLVGILDGRNPEARAKLVKSGGGTKESERAVELGLQWLARHQRPDGSWSFQHGPDDPGILDCPTGATGLALLAFLGAGNTPKQGPYRSQVIAGLKYMVDHIEMNDSGGWLLGTGQATMYVQGIGAIALCEAYHLTKDPALKGPAQKVIDFIVRAQDPEGGGWRYRIPQAGDTSVVGWQLMALQSAKIAELNVAPRVLVRAARFLKSVETERGAAYGYNTPNSVRPTMTAVGLLCRMYLGREQTHKGMMRGMRRLSDWGPNPADMYFNYYATQALHHWGGSGWEKWNAVMRDQLVNRQEQEGDGAGSWPPDASHGVNMGGRLYTTCLSIVTLEVYYRHLSLYRRPPAPDDE